MYNSCKFKEGDWVVLESEDHYEYVLKAMKDQGFVVDTENEWFYEYEGEGSILRILDDIVYCEYSKESNLEEFEENDRMTQVNYPLPSKTPIKYWNGEGVPEVGEMLTVNNCGNIYNCILEYYGEALIVVKLLGYPESREQHFHLSYIQLSPCKEFLEKKERIAKLEAELEELKAQL